MLVKISALLILREIRLQSPNRTRRKFPRKYLDVLRGDTGHGNSIGQKKIKSAAEWNRPTVCVTSSDFSRCSQETQPQLEQSNLWRRYTYTYFSHYILLPSTSSLCVFTLFTSFCIIVVCSVFCTKRNSSSRRSKQIKWKPKFNRDRARSCTAKLAQPMQAIVSEKELEACGNVKRRGDVRGTLR